MNDQKIELPPLPEWLGWPVTVSEMTASEVKEVMQDYALAAIEADRQRRGEPVAGCTMVPVEPTPQMIAAFRSGFQNELHKNDRRRTMSAEEAGLRAMLKASPQPAEPVKVSSDDEILAWAGEEQFFLFADPEEVLDIVKSALQHFGQPKPSNSGELEPAASAQPVVNQSLADALNDALDNLLHDNYERSYSGSKNREADAELIRAALAQQPVGQDREDAERYRWLRDPCSGAEHIIFYSRGDYGKGLMSGEMLDAAIDAARAAKEDHHD